MARSFKNMCITAKNAKEKHLTYVPYGLEVLVQTADVASTLPGGKRTSIVVLMHC